MLAAIAIFSALFIIAEIARRKVERWEEKQENIYREAHYRQTYQKKESL
jgi:hypothetical protein